MYRKLFEKKAGAYRGSMRFARTLALRRAALALAMRFIIMKTSLKLKLSQPFRVTCGYSCHLMSFDVLIAWRTVKAEVASSSLVVLARMVFRQKLNGLRI
jgi:hypothetical protein